MPTTEGRLMPSISDDVRAIEEALADRPGRNAYPSGVDGSLDYARDVLAWAEGICRACDPARLRRVLDTMQAQARALKTLLPMVEEWHEEFPRDVGDAEAPAIEAARAALALYEGKQ